MTTPTPEERAEWQALGEAATDGPWEAFRRGDPSGPFGVCSEAAGDVDPDIFDGARSAADAAFIAAAREGWPRTLAALEDAEAALERVRALWGGGDHPPVFLSDRPNKIVRATARRADLGCDVTESLLRVSDVRAALLGNQS